MKGLIVAGGVDVPLYKVKLVHDTTWHDKEVLDAEKAVSTLTKALDKANIAKVDALIERENLPANASKIKFYIVQDKIDQADYRIKRYTALIKISQGRIAALVNSKVPDLVVDVWCADYTLGLVGEVGLCEQLLAGGAKRYTIYPDGIDPAKTSRNASYVPLNDGRQVETATMPPLIWFINAAREPWRYKWKPQYVKGVVVSNDSAVNTLDVAIENQTLGISHLAVNDKIKTTSISADYMGIGDSAIYEIGDEVLVEFPTFSPSLPIVNGFSINPRQPFLWADSQYIAVDWGRRISYSVNAANGDVSIFMPSMQPTVSSLFPSPALNSTNKIEYIGISSGGFFIATIDRSVSKTFSATGQTLNIRCIEKRRFYSVGASLTVLFLNESTADFSQSSIIPDEQGLLQYLGTGDIIGGVIPTFYTHSPFVDEEWFFIEIFRENDYIYNIAVVFNYRISGVNMKNVSRVLNAVSIVQAGRYMIYTSSDYPVGTFGATGRYADGIISKYDYFYGDLDISKTASIMGEGFVFSWNVYDDGSLNSNGFYNDLLKFWYDVYTTEVKYRTLGSPLLKRNGRNLSSETWFDNKGKRSLKIATLIPKWTLKEYKAAGGV